MERQCRSLGAIVLAAACLAGALVAAGCPKKDDPWARERQAAASDDRDQDEIRSDIASNQRKIDSLVEQRSLVAGELTDYGAQYSDGQWHAVSVGVITDRAAFNTAVQKWNDLSNEIGRCQDQISRDTGLLHYYDHLDQKYGGPDVSQDVGRRAAAAGSRIPTPPVGTGASTGCGCKP